MSLLVSKRDDSRFSCPAEGKWYACSSGSFFVGCCASDPCANGCPQGNIRPGSFDRSQYGKFPDASCGLNSNFYTCMPKNATTSFWGCCKTNPCADDPKCPDGNLVGAFLDKPEQKSAYGISSPGKKTNVAAIAGGAAGGAVAVAIIVGLIIFFMRRKRSRNSNHDHKERLSMMAAEKSDQESGHEYAHPVNSPGEAAFPAQGAHADHLHPAYANSPRQAHSPPPQELPAESTKRFSELESPWPSPARPQELESPQPSPALDGSRSATTSVHGTPRVVSSSDDQSGTAALGIWTEVGHRRTNGA